MNSGFSLKRTWLAGAILALLVFLALAPMGRVLADTNPFDPPITAPAEPGTTPNDTTIVVDPGTNTAPLTAWDILYAIIVAL
jgi:hypothetical protein